MVERRNGAGFPVEPRLARSIDLPHAADTDRRLDEALRIATQVCDALNHAHRIGVVHRD